MDAAARLIDAALPRWDVVSRHHTRVAAPPAYVYRAARGLDLRAAPLMRTLFLLRSLPGLLPRAGRRQAPLGSTLDGLLRTGFVVLGERPGEELLLGLVGRFWTPGGDIQRVTPPEFAAWDRPGFARAAWNFTVAPAGDGATRLATETRVKCTDEASARRFRRYWRVVGPFSGLIRREMLWTLRRGVEAERT